MASLHDGGGGGGGGGGVKRARSGSRIEIVPGGDLLSATEPFILHQSNCTSKGARGLAAAIHQRFPEADCYKRRQPNRSTPGTIDVTACRSRPGIAIVVS